jgi:hypothetical protein
MKRYRTPFNLQVVEFAKVRNQFFIGRDGGKALIHESRAADGPQPGLPGGCERPAGNSVSARVGANSPVAVPSDTAS